MSANTTPPGALAHRDLQRRVVRVLVAGQVLGGLGAGATLSLGALLITRVSGSPAWSGMAATMATLGAAALAVPLARLAQARGRRTSLSTGALLAVAGAGTVVTAAVLVHLWLLLAGVLLLGSGQALNLQARFAATDLAAASRRGRDLSLVVWSTTVGAVAGPNLFEPGEAVGRALDLPSLTGGFVISAVAQALGALVYLVGLRPDPLLTATAAARAGADVAATSTATGERRTGGLSVLRFSPAARRAVLTVAFSHAVMVALMSMTPVHLSSHGASLGLVGLTISLHVAGMYALSPLFGHLTDRLGARTTVLLGQALLLLALLLAVLGPEDTVVVTAGLVLLGLGWSASTVAGAALVSAAVSPVQRPRLQGVSDALMSLAGAVGGAAAGPVLARAGFDGLAAVLLVLVAATVLAQRERRSAAAG
ncbi:MFS family permease [Kineococcus radiotolerans]|uniref:MFS family permease n=1 Tax=Kineococcus radiotolerans TaxID=131568 RepID=A0A7W4TQ20_KINRA|nr:MFS transporter [Kineococcus radiotolerans]MBB2902977.1 MFS family permease [Kineococcus radiotolerans]